MSDIYKTLTPAFRSEIQDSIRAQLSELNTCKENALVSAQRTGLLALAEIVKALPDGYPMPMKRN